MKQSDIDSMIEDWVENGLPEELQQLIPTESQCVTCGCTWDKPCYAYHVGPCWWVDDTETICSHCHYQILHHSPYDELGRRLMVDGSFWYKPSSILWTVTKDSVIHTLSPQNRFGTFPYSKVDVNHNWGNVAQLTQEEAMWLTLEMRPELTDFI
ncbi:hypothetical protein [Streptococcus suis]|uniref:hypothetical protein n=1 Tax=Streptococcus suis TaxID=1307 RepID=UPI0009454878|nr:hypothetical protein [Streptococcus suis]RRR58433.1 hypothetical protein EI995_04290 [Streptococcus suis]RRR65066.1 hypothetical protein EI993_00235 [Streptococcus suis]